MAVVTLTAQEAVVNTPKAVTQVASTTDGFQVIPPTGCESFFFLINNTSADTDYSVTLKAPTNKNFGSAQADGDAVDVAFGDMAVIFVETARWEDASTGYILVDSENAALEVACVYKF